MRLSESDNYISAEDISTRVKELGLYYTKKFGQNEIVAITMMNGAKMFGTDLIRAIDNPNLLDDNMRATSYIGDRSSGSVKIHHDISLDIKDRHVLLIEDILDTGTTLSCVVPELWKRGPKSISLACMFEKPSKRKIDTEFRVDDIQIGMRIADKFILGYGLDWKDPDGISRYRSLPFITVAKFTKKSGIDWVVPMEHPEQ